MKRFPAHCPQVAFTRAALLGASLMAIALMVGCSTPANDETVEPPLVTGKEYFERGEALRARKKYDEAIAAYNQAIEQDSSFVEAYSARGYVKNAKGDLRGALADYDRGVFYNPLDVATHTGRGNARRDLGDIDGAIADYDEVLRLHGGATDVRLSRAQIELDRGQLEAAVRDLKAALQSNPGNRDALRILADARLAGVHDDQKPSPDLTKAIFELGLLSEQPHPILRTPPIYPYALRKKRVTGKVIVEFIVTSNGDVVNAFAVRATNADLATAAVVAVSQWKFIPGRVKGRAVNTRMQQPISFDLEEVSPKK